MKTITVSFPLGLFGNATMNVPESAVVEESVMAPPLDRELLALPKDTPEPEGAGPFFDFDDAAD